jgi:hypothetical protein
VAADHVLVAAGDHRPERVPAAALDRPVGFGHGLRDEHAGGRGPADLHHFQFQEGKLVLEMDDHGAVPAA